LNLQTPIPEIASSLVGSNESSAHVQHVMSVNLGFGGSNAALTFSRSAPS
jgi:3-oxoacyl-(acyl-carrier-protein) synthase